MKIHCIRHEPFEGLACIENWIISHDHSLTYTHTYLDQSYPPDIDFDFLIIMGGTASLYEKKNKVWLEGEKKFIQKAMDADKKILGICLGAQILAQILGAEVYPNKQKEIGWFDVRFHTGSVPELSFLPEKTETFHWHGDTFDIPEGAHRIASSELTPNQGFIFNMNILALQFHLEMTATSQRKLIRAMRDDLREGGNIQDAETIMSKTEELVASGNELMYE
ncbi:MAG: type 1 glutamine amidotransferase, partial [Bacteroidales bacterium]